ncbi:DUF6074 family protein [Mesorhizobium sp. IMUNJ 23232]|uniref:DUF6074 family protein n=1 Tax=Mesorhizobium sp. IMUNJ 23232 TaxID=3376064 RepID=UPI0037AB218C
MKDETDLPLFAWTPPPCQIIAFPQAKRIGKVRHVVGKLENQSEKQRHNYWGGTLFELERKLEEIGFPETVIEAEVGAFTDAVNAEIRRRDARRHATPRPGGNDAA